MANRRDFLKMLGAGATGAAALRFSFPSSAPCAADAKAGDISERVLDTGILRVAYIVYPPYVVKDLNSGVLSGLYYDMMMRLAADLDVRIEWVEEVTFANPFEGFYTNRYDLVSANIWPNGHRARRSDFTLPICYNGFNVYTRRGAEHNYRALKALNRQDIRIAVIDGEGFLPLVQSLCPNATMLRLPDSSSNAELAIQVLTRKADVTFLEIAFANKFMRQNPNTLEALMPDPVQVFPAGLSVPRHQQAFKAMLNVMVENLLNTGFIDELLDKYQTTEGDFLRVAKSYQSLPARH